MNLPENTILGKLEMIEVYEFDDKPLLFSCRNGSDSIFMVVLVDEDEEYDTWLYAGVSKRRFELIRSGAIDLHDAFWATEDGLVFEVKSDIESNAPLEVIKKQSELLGEDDLPLPNARLYLNTATLPELDGDLFRLAKQSSREYLRLAFDFPSKLRTEAPAKMLGEILEALQDLVSVIGDKLHGEGHQVGQISGNILSQLELSVVKVGPGSFKIELASSDLTNLFGESNIGNALEVFMFLLKLEDNEDDLKRQLQDLKQRVASKYLTFLKTIKKDIDGTHFDWASPRPGYRNDVFLTSEKVNRIIDIIELIEEQPPKEFQIIGDLIGANLHTKDFEIWISRGEEKYSGKILNEAIDSVKNATLSMRYVATILETTKIKPMVEDGIEIKYTLLRLDPYESDGGTNQER